MKKIDLFYQTKFIHFSAIINEIEHEAEAETDA